MNQRTILLIALLLLAGCDTSDPTTQPQGQIDNPPAVTASPEPSTDATEQPTAEIPAEISATVIRVIDGDTVNALTDNKESVRVRLNGRHVNGLSVSAPAVTERYRRCGGER